MGRSPSSTKGKEGMNRGAWTALEDQILKDYISAHGEGKWSSIPKNAGLKRCGKSCRLRWLNYLRPDIKRGNISHDEEDLIIRLHKLLGNRWSLIAGRLPGRTDNEIKNYWNTTLAKKAKAVESKQLGNAKPKANCVDSVAIRTKASRLREVSVSPETRNQESNVKSAVKEDSTDGEYSAKMIEIGSESSDIDLDSKEDFNFGELLMSDFSDSDFWKMCQIDYNGVEEAGAKNNKLISLEQPLLFSEEMLKDWISSDDT